MTLELSLEKRNFSMSEGSLKLAAAEAERSRRMRRESRNGCSSRGRYTAKFEWVNLMTDWEPWIFRKTGGF